MKPVFALPSVSLLAILIAILLALLAVWPAWAARAGSEADQDTGSEADQVNALTTRAEYIMGTVFQITLETAQAARFERVFAILREHDRVLSDYDPDSELNRVQPAARRDWTPVSPILCRALSESRQIGALSEGAFDISVGPLVALWGFKDQQFRVPGEADIAARLAASGWDAIGLRRQAGACALRLSHALTALDFGGIGKGLALDAAADWLLSQGVKAAALDAGGSSMRFLGAPPGSPRGWPVLLRRAGQSLWLRNQSLASSDHDQQFFEAGGVRYGHILDPRSGRPVPAGSGVTVIGARATAADALSTALMVLPLHAGDRLADLLGYAVLRTRQDQPIR